MVYIPPVLHPQNYGSDEVIKPIELQFQWTPLLALFAGRVLAGFLFPSVSFLFTIGIIALLFHWSRYWIWTCFLLPEAIQSEYIARSNRWDKLEKITGDMSKWLVIKNPAYNRFKNRKIPTFLFVEAYRRGDIGVPNDDLPRNFENLDEWSITAMNWDYFHFLIFGYILDVFVHTRDQDTDQVQAHYDTGNDFFRGYLGKRMVYTSGYFYDGTESLEQGQDQKMEIVANKIKLAPGMKVLDLGCGWGTWTMYTAQKWGTHTSGLSIAKEQIKFCSDRAELNGIKNVEWLCRDYRDMPRRSTENRKFDRVTCFEMAEHVGVKRFQEFLAMVWDALEDDGLFYLQIAGLRERWQHEEVGWGLFMWRYIFRGADASLPLNWVSAQLEQAGFHSQSVECVDYHYTRTIRLWRDNLVANKELIIKKYGEELFRIYDIFLSWSPLIGDRGGSTCWQIVAYKNLDTFKRNTFMGVTSGCYTKNKNLDDLKELKGYEQYQ
eukprot:TRINITY_DN8810_c0_g1_i1.p1 TRINITY_DN8810_c0_g1~~TRINITY_DN8810_c0_g1_i1.p1  ORF type:complete len:503 (-),score=149.88 TRINITY_DN8810_c0_g1_i1:244-1719(-)